MSDSGNPSERKQTMKCVNCSKPIIPKTRYTKLNIETCLDCGNHNAKLRRYTIAPINKSNYMLITDLEMLKQLNPKRTTWKPTNPAEKALSQKVATS